MKFYSTIKSYRMGGTIGSKQTGQSISGGSEDDAILTSPTSPTNLNYTADQFARAGADKSKQ